MKILHAVSSLRPASGGTAACLSALTPALVALGHQSETVCLDRADELHLADFPGTVHALGPSHLGYGYGSQLLPWLRRETPRFDAVVVHGLWQYHGFAVRRALRADSTPPYFVFPHGMLDPWFQRAYRFKHLKKMLYWSLVERSVLRDAAAVLFTCQAEQDLATDSFGDFGDRSRVVTFGTTGAEGDPAEQRAAWDYQIPALKNKPFWLFLGRIHAKKGVDLLLEAYASLARRSDETLPELVIAGPNADQSYLDRLQARAAALCPAGRVHWTGMLTGAPKWGALRSAEAFVLPSHQENFGIAVTEALSCGTPVLITDKVNIWHEIKTDHAGLVAPDDARGIETLLSRWRQLSANARGAMRVSAAQCFQRRYAISTAANHLARVLAQPHHTEL